MAYKVVATTTFLREYRSIIDYHLGTLHAPQAARSLIEELDNMHSILASTPEVRAVSRKEALFNKQLREYLVRNYVVVYRIEDRGVYLVHMFHQLQNFEELLE